MTSAAPVRVGVAGLGYWGPNLARNFDRLPGAELAWICDGSEEALTRTAAGFPDARASTDMEEMLRDPELDAVVVATPVPTHAELAERVLAAGKHCFVEKPLAQSAADAERVVEVAREAGRTLMVGHLLEYHPGLDRLGEIAAAGELGDPAAHIDRQDVADLVCAECWEDVASQARVEVDERPWPQVCRGLSPCRRVVSECQFAERRINPRLAVHLGLERAKVAICFGFGVADSGALLS